MSVVCREKKQSSWRTIINLIILAACLCFLCAPEVCSQKRRSDREFDGLVGLVHVVREYRTFSQQRLKAAEVRRLLQWRPYKTLTYDRAGNLLEEDNRWGLRYTYTYSPVGLRVKTANGDVYPDSGNPIPSYIAERSADKFDPSGNKSETIVYLQSEIIPWFRETFEYDDRGRLRTRSHFGRDATANLKLSYVVIHTYDRRGNETEACWRDPNGALMDRLSYTNYKVDRMGNWVERTEKRYQVFDPNQPKEQRETVYRFITYY